MAKRRPSKPYRGKKSGYRSKGGGGGGSALKLRKLDGDRGWAIVPPLSAEEMSDDIAEVHEMLEHGELEIATDELRFLLSTCPELLEAHVLLGQIALETDDTKPADIELARGHFGYAFQLGEKALTAASCPGPLLGAEPTNAPWHEAARGLAWCLEKQGQRAMADQVAATVRKFDPSDPAQVAAMLDDLRAGGLPIVELG